MNTRSFITPVAWEVLFFWTLGNLEHNHPLLIFYSVRSAVHCNPCSQTHHDRNHFAAAKSRKTPTFPQYLLWTARYMKQAFSSPSRSPVFTLVRSPVFTLVRSPVFTLVTCKKVNTCSEAGTVIQPSRCSHSSLACTVNCQYELQSSE